MSDLIQTYAKESRSLREQIAEICLFMNGGIEWDTAWGISFEDREIIIKAVNKKLKAENPNSKEYM